jgi:pilus assembly protein CpaB
MKQKIVLIIAILMGLAAFLLTHNYLRAQRDALTKGYTKVSVLVAKVDLPTGTILVREDLAAKEVFKSAVGANIFKKEDIDLILNKKLLLPLKRGEPVWWSHVDAPQTARRGLSQLVNPGLRAISVAVSGENAVSGLVNPGDRVDLLGTFTTPSPTMAGEMETATLTVLQNVLVLATGDEIANQSFSTTRSSRSRGYSTVTLQVTTEEAEVLVFSQTVKGQLTLSLRNPDDVETMRDIEEVDFNAMQEKLPQLNDRRQQLLIKNRNM